VKLFGGASVPYAKLLITTQDIFYNVYSHKEKNIQCRYETPREEAREGHDFLVIEKRIGSVFHQALPRGE
jgi:hypothetical protein